MIRLCIYKTFIRFRYENKRNRDMGVGSDLPLRFDRRISMKRRNDRIFSNLGRFLRAVINTVSI